MIKVDIISGFLGAGKTTVIKKLFESHTFKNEKVVLIENEFGEIGIDGSFLKESGINIKEINAGCICCSLVGDFEKSITELVNTYNPQRIIIEPSGVGKLSDIIEAVKKVDLDLKINILATVVDAKKVKMYLKNFGEFFNNQVNAADTIVVAKVDTCSEDKVEESVNLIKEVNDKANIITTNINTLDADRLVSFLEEKASMRNELVEMVEHEHHHHHHHHDEDEECCCGHHEHHHHDHDEDEECCCGHHEHHHHHDEDEECCCGHHEHHHHHEEDEECCCGHHEHHHHDHDEDEECCCGHHEHHHHHDEDEECCCGHHEHHHHHDHDHECDDPNCSCHHHDADEVFTSWGKETSRSYSHTELENILKVLCDDNSNLGMILRSKGIVKASDCERWYYFDLVAGDYEIRLGEPDYTGRVVVIGSHIDEDKIDELFTKKGN